MIIVYDTTTLKVVSQGEFDPAINTPEGHAFFETEDTALVIGYLVDPATNALRPDPEIELLLRWQTARILRDRLLAESDYLIMPDYPITEESRTAVRAYRRALRDITKTQDDPADFVWPTFPAIETLDETDA